MCLYSSTTHQLQKKYRKKTPRTCVSISGKAVLFWSLDIKNNATVLNLQSSQISELQADTILYPRQIRIYASASPEGTGRLNRELSHLRANRIADYLRSSLSLPDSLIHIHSHGVDWESLKQLATIYDTPYKSEVLDILHHMPEHTHCDDTAMYKHELETLRDGEPYRYMYEYLFPELRVAETHIVVNINRLHSPASPCSKNIKCISDTLGISFSQNKAAAANTTMPSHRAFNMSLKNNMLYDAVLVPNIGVEFHIGKGWSVGGTWMYAWWKNGNRHHYWRIYGGELGIRKYFGRQASEKPLTGHHLGLYGQVLTYDFEFGGTGYMAGVPGGTLFDKANYAAGIEYGYSLPISRKLNIDFSLGVGYMGGLYYEYRPIDGCDVWQSTRQGRWFGPTKAEISLIWLIGSGTTGKGKGGTR